MRFGPGLVLDLVVLFFCFLFNPLPHVLYLSSCICIAVNQISLASNPLSTASLVRRMCLFMRDTCLFISSSPDRTKCKQSGLESSLHVHACRNGLVPADSRWIVIQWSATRSPGCIHNGERGNRIIGVVAAQSSAASLLPSVADFSCGPSQDLVNRICSQNCRALVSPWMEPIEPMIPGLLLRTDRKKRGGGGSHKHSSLLSWPGGAHIRSFIQPRFWASNRDAFLTLINPAFIPSVDLSCLRPRVETGNEKAKPQTPLARLAKISSNRRHSRTCF